MPWIRLHVLEAGVIVVLLTLFKTIQKMPICSKDHLSCHPLGGSCSTKFTDLNLYLAGKVIITRLNLRVFFSKKKLNGGSTVTWNIHNWRCCERGTHQLPGQKNSFGWHQEKSWSWWASCCFEPPKRWKETNLWSQLKAQQRSPSKVYQSQGHQQKLFKKSSSIIHFCRSYQIQQPAQLTARKFLCLWWWIWPSCSRTFNCTPVEDQFTWPDLNLSWMNDLKIHTYSSILAPLLDAWRMFLMRSCQTSWMSMDELMICATTKNPYIWGLF